MTSVPGATTHSTCPADWNLASKLTERPIFKLSNHRPFQGTHATQQRMQQQWKQTSDRWNQKSRDQGWKNLQAQRQYQLAGENARRIRETLAAEQAASNQSEAGWQNGSTYRCWFCQMSVRAGSAYCTNCGEPVQPPRSAQRGAERPSSWKKRVGIMILITGGLLTLGAILQAHSSSGTPGGNSSSGASAGTPGVIIVDANIRTGPGTENSIAATAPAGTKIVISCGIATPAGSWDRLTYPYRDLSSARPSYSPIAQRVAEH
jgi:hypothetical protein